MLEYSNIGKGEKRSLYKRLSKPVFTLISALGLSSCLLVQNALAMQEDVNTNINATNNVSVVNTSAANQAQNLPLKDHILRVAFSVAPPFVVVSGKFSDLRGIEVDLVREMQKRTGFRTTNDTYDIMNFSEMMDVSARGDIDIVAGGIYANQDRFKTYDFAGPTYQTCVTLVTNSSSNIDEIKDLEGKFVAAENGTVSADLIPPESNVNVKMVYTPTSFMALYNVSRGLADAVIVDEPLAQEYIDNWPESALEIKMRMPDSEADMAILLKKNTEATRILQATYEEMLKDGTVAKIVRKYNKNVDVSGLLGKQALKI